MKAWLKVLLGIVGAIVLMIAAVFYFTSDVTRAGDDLFAAIADGNMEEAYGTLSIAFQANTSESEFATYIAANHMDKVAATNWSSRSVSGANGSLSGTLTSANGESIPVELDLIKEGGDWKIYAIRKSADQAGAAYGSRGIPGEQEQVSLVIGSMNAFVDSIAANDMTALHEHIARLWAGQMDAAQLGEAFKSFYRFGSGLQVVKTMSPALSGRGTLSDDRILVIEGRYPTDPNLQFTLKYIYEGMGWKLVGLSAEFDGQSAQD